MELGRTKEEDARFIDGRIAETARADLIKNNGQGGRTLFKCDSVILVLIPYVLNC